jgi:hypothetical protein
MNGSSSYDGIRVRTSHVLRRLMKNCNYRGQAESMLRDQLVLGVADASTREKLLFEKDLSLVKALDILRACEASKIQLESMKAAGAVQTVHQLASSAQSRATGLIPSRVEVEPVTRVATKRGTGLTHALSALIVRADTPRKGAGQLTRPASPVARGAIMPGAARKRGALCMLSKRRAAKSTPLLRTCQPVIS